MAIFEASPETFQRSLPGLASGYALGKIGCVDVTVRWHERSGVLGVDVEGLDLEKVLQVAGVPLPVLGGTPDQQLEAAASALGEALAALSHA